MAMLCCKQRHVMPCLVTPAMHAHTVALVQDHTVPSSNSVKGHNISIAINTLCLPALGQLIHWETRSCSTLACWVADQTKVSGFAILTFDNAVIV